MAANYIALCNCGMVKNMEFQSHESHFFWLLKTSLDQWFCRWNAVTPVSWFQYYQWHWSWHTSHGHKWGGRFLSKASTVFCVWGGGGFSLHWHEQYMTVNKLKNLYPYFSICRQSHICFRATRQHMDSF